MFTVPPASTTIMHRCKDIYVLTKQPIASSDKTTVTLETMMRLKSFRARRSTCHLTTGLSQLLRLVTQDALEVYDKIIKITHVKVFSRLFSCRKRNTQILGYHLFTKIMFKNLLNISVFVFETLIDLFFTFTFFNS